MMKKLILSALIAASVVSCSYDKINRGDVYYDSKYLLTVCNYSAEDILCLVPYKDMEVHDTVSASNENYFVKVPAKTYAAYIVVHNDNVSPFESYGTEDKVPFFFFKAKDVKGLKWAEIKAGELWEGICSYSATDIINMQKTINYPDCLADN